MREAFGVRVLEHRFLSAPWVIRVASFCGHVVNMFSAPPPSPVARNDAVLC